MESKGSDQLKKRKNGRLAVTLLIIIAILVGYLWYRDFDNYRELPDCENLLEGTVNKNFSIETNGIAKHKTTGLKWYRCNAGQRFNNGKCTGKILVFNWKEAMKFPSEISKNSAVTWRLPTNDEIQSLKQEKCRNPALDKTIFPGIEVANYWTSTVSRRGALFGCSFYSYEGRISCLMRKEKYHPLMLILE